MAAALDGVPPAPFQRPSGVVDGEVCALSGLLPTPECRENGLPVHGTVRDLFVARTGLAVVHRGETFSGVGASMGRTYNININAAPGTDPARLGREVVYLIRAYERSNGNDWRTGAIG